MRKVNTIKNQWTWKYDNRNQSKGKRKRQINGGVERESERKREWEWIQGLWDKTKWSDTEIRVPWHERENGAEALNR